MNVVKTIEQYEENNIFFCEPIKNNIMNDGNFIRLLYSTHNIVLNGIFIYITFNEITVEKHYNKYKCCFNVNLCKNLIDKIKIIEENILKKVNIYDKIPQLKIYEQMSTGNIKIFCDATTPKTNSSFILKISGIWENNFNYGLTYKFTKIN
jgi:hypothetical protein